MASNKVKTRPERCSLERKLEGLEVDLKGEAFGQISGECQSDLKGEIEKGQAKPLFLTAGEVRKIIKA